MRFVKIKYKESSMKTTKFALAASLLAALCVAPAAFAADPVQAAIDNGKTVHHYSIAGSWDTTTGTLIVTSIKGKKISVGDTLEGNGLGATGGYGKVKITSFLQGSGTYGSNGTYVANQL